MQNLINYQLNKMKSDNLLNKSITDFSLSKIEKVHQFQRTHHKYKETPLIRLSNLAKHLHIGNIFVKNEAERFGLNAFKVLGGIYAIGRYLSKQLNRDIETLSFEELKSPRVKELLGEKVFISATDGNHGKGVAWAARELGHQAIIYLPIGAARRRVEAIQNQGAKAVVTKYNYDDAVRIAAKDAEKNGWIVLQDTSWEGYEEIPHWIMQGYASLAKESIDQLKKYTEKAPTHLFLQVGVGSYAASIAAYFLNYYRGSHPKIILVEPHQANCYYESFVHHSDEFQTVGGNLDTIMAGLSCGEPNPQAWDILKKCTDVSFATDDRVAALGMRVLGLPLGGDERIVAGDSGAVPAGLLYCLATDDRFKNIKDKLGMDEHSQIVLINTEGDTDPDHYKEVVWEGAYPLK